MHILSNFQDPKSINRWFPWLRRSTPVHHEFKLPSQPFANLQDFRRQYLFRYEYPEWEVQGSMDTSVFPIVRLFSRRQAATFSTSDVCSLARLWLCPGPIFKPYYLKPAYSHGYLPIASHSLFFLRSIIKYLEPSCWLAQRILTILYLTKLEWFHGQVHPGQVCIQGV